MIYVLFLVQTIAAADLFEVASVPVEDELPQVFFAAVDGNSTADLVVQNGRDLHIRLDNGSERVFTLPGGVAAYDIYDIGDDEQREIIAVQGRQILAFEPLVDSAGQSSGRLLFEADSLYAMEMPEPCPQVLVKTFQQQLAVLLPQGDNLIAFSLNGTILAQFPDLPDVPRMHDELTSQMQFNPGIAPSESRSTYVTQDLELIPDLPPELQPPDVPFAITLGDYFYADPDSNLSARFGFDMGDYSGSWDGVIVSRDANRIQFAMLRNDDNGNTLVFMREVPLTAEGEDWQNAKNGPVRRYPGRMVSRYRWSALDTLDQRPDFNGDGFMDLLLWDAPKPGMSVESIVRTAVSRTWPLRLTVHLYSPDKQRFEPKPAHSLSCKVPITWILESGPFQILALADFDGDGMTDIALSTDESELQVWLANSGFSRNPDWTHTFPEPLQDVLRIADLSGNGRTSILLCGEKNLYLLQARK